ncbi:MAG: UDP-glucuronic acid decarboxylase family protein [Desulfitobacteriaceae bacterium]
MRILVAGGAGFIGTNLCRRLLTEGHEVVCVDNFYTSTRDNIEELLDNAKFRLVEQDIQESLDLKVDQIYNLACPASPPHYQKDPINTVKTNFLGTMNLLELAGRLEVPMLQASTSEVYGDPIEHPQKETYWGHVNCTGIRSCYDEGKRVAETLCVDYRRQYGVNSKIVRIFNTYGPYMDPKDGRVVSNFIMQALAGKPLTVYGDGSQTRSFCYVDDLVDGLIRMMSSQEYGPVNLGNPSEFTMIELAEKVLRLTGSSSQIEHEPLPEDDPQKRKPDITRAKKLLDWEPKVSLEQGLKKTITYFGSLVLY